MESPTQGLGSTLSLPWWNQRGDSRAERENDSNVLEYVVVITVEPFGGFFGRLRLPLNDVREWRCGGAWAREGRPLLRHPREDSPASDANPAKRIASEKEEQGSERSFRRKAEAESSGLCDDAIPPLVPPW